MEKKRYNILFHLIGWMAFIGFQFILFPKPEKLLGNKEAMPFIVEQLIINTICITFFYLNYLVLLPRLYFNRRFLLYVAAVLAFVTLSVFILRNTHPETLTPNTIPTNEKGVPEFSENPLAPPAPAKKATPRPLIDEKLLIYGNFLLKFFISFLLSLGFKLYGRWQLAEEEKYKAELSFLKAQINPHFLFNTLNGIYVLAIKKSENTPSAIMKLSSIMRYVISEGHHDFVELDKEIKYIQDYVDLQKMRLAGNITLDFTIQPIDKSYKIAPLILIPFIENAFKHGISTQKECVIKIHIYMVEKLLHLLVENTIFHNSLREEEKSGIGVENTRKRLQLLYAGKYDLAVENKDSQYSVLLKLELA